MKRRDFITLLGGTAVAWPLAVRAQQPDHVRRIGLLTILAESDPEGHARGADRCPVLGVDRTWPDDTAMSQIEPKPT